MVAETQTLNMQCERALRLLARGSRIKSRLAVEIYGEDNTSTRSMISRLSKQLMENGWATETRQGRERFMEITPKGRERIGATDGQSSKQEPVPPIPSLTEALESLRPSGDQPFHPHDRPRFHLRHAALLALAELRGTGIRTVADEHYEAMLRTLVHDDGGSETRDKKVFTSLAATWPGSDRRKRLTNCLVNFQYPDSNSRRETGPEFVLLADKMTSGAEAILWASGAIDLAHHYSFAPASQMDRMTARKLLRQAKELLDKTSLEYPAMRVAAAYRLGKLGKVATVGWSWDGHDVAEERQPRTEASAHNEDEALQSVLETMDHAVIRAGRFNFELESYEGALRSYLGRWVLLALPSSEWVFRRAGGLDIAHAIEDWAVDVRERGLLGELLVSRVRDQENAPLRQRLKDFLRVGERYRQEKVGMQLEPYMAQAQALLGESVSVRLEPEVFDPKAAYYQRMLMNNLWNPEMVVAHTMAAAVTGVSS
jgi:hypothetical protein